MCVDVCVWMEVEGFRLLWQSYNLHTDRHTHMHETRLLSVIRLRCKKSGNPFMHFQKMATDVRMKRRRTIINKETAWKLWSRLSYHSHKSHIRPVCESN